MRVGWNKGLKGEDYKKHFSKGFGGTFQKGQPSRWKGTKGLRPANSGSFKKGLVPWNKGKKFSEESRLKMSVSKRGKNCYCWKGGITQNIYLKIRDSFEYTNWRYKVFHRDNYTCQKCGARGPLEAHHKKRFRVLLREFKIETIEQAVSCKELWELDNGITLCKKCHKLEHKRKN